MEKESVKKFDLEAAFKALDEIEIPETKGIKANRVDLKERFNQKSAHETLVEDYYDVSSNEDLEKAQEEREGEVAQAKLARIEKIVDLDAETADDLLPSYVGKVIMQCPQCMTLFYKNPEDIEHSEENPDVVNINEVCQHCGNTSGYTLIGKVDSVSEEEADKYEAAEGSEENELDLDFEEPTEEVDAEGTGEGAEEMSDEEFDELNLELEEIPEEEEEATESLNLSKAAPSEEETEYKSENLTLNEGWKEAGYTSEEICNKAIEDGIKEHGGREGFIEYIKTIRPAVVEQEDDERKQKEADALIELVKNYKVEESLNVSTEAPSENETENGSENLTLNEEVDKDLDKKLAEHNDYIEYLKNLINQDEEALKKAENEEIKSAIQRHLDTLNADLEAALPDALKSVPEVAVDELADSEPVEEPVEEPTEVQAEEEPKEEPAEEEAPVEEALTEDGAEEEKPAEEPKDEGNEVNYVDYKHSYCHILSPKLRGLHYLVFQKGIEAGKLIGYIKKLLKDPLVRWTDKEQEFKKNLEAKTDPKDIYNYVKNSIEKAKTIKVKVDENGELIESLNEGFEGCLYEVLTESLNKSEEAPSEYETENGSENLTLNEAADPADEILAIINSWDFDEPKTEPAPAEDPANAPVDEEPVPADDKEAANIIDTWESLEESLSEEKLAEFKANDFFKDLKDVDIKKIIRIYKEDMEIENDDELVADEVADYVLSGTIGGFIFANIEKLTNTCIYALAQKDPKFIEALKQYYPDPVDSDEELIEIVFGVEGTQLEETIDALDEIYHNLSRPVNEMIDKAAQSGKKLDDEELKKVISDDTKSNKEKAKIIKEDAEDALDMLLDSKEFKKPISDEEVLGYFEGYTGNPAERTTHLEYTDDDPTDGKAVLPDNIEKQLTEDAVELTEGPFDWIKAKSDNKKDLDLIAKTFKTFEVKYLKDDGTEAGTAKKYDNLKAAIEFAKSWASKSSNGKAIIRGFKAGDTTGTIICEYEYDAGKKQAKIPSSSNFIHTTAEHIRQELDDAKKDKKISKAGDKALKDAPDADKVDDAKEPGKPYHIVILPGKLVVSIGGQTDFDTYAEAENAALTNSTDSTLIVVAIPKGKDKYVKLAVFKNGVADKNNAERLTKFVSGTLVEESLTEEAEPEEIEEPVADTEANADAQPDTEETPNIVFTDEEAKDIAVDVAKEVAEPVEDEEEAEKQEEEIKEVAEERVEAAVEEKLEAEEEAEEPEFSEEDIDDLDECSLNKHIDEYLKEVYSNVKSYETTNCELKEGKLFVEGKIAFKSGKEKLTMFEFLPAYCEGKLFFEGYNKDFSEDRAFTLNCSINESKTLITESFGYKYAVGETLVEGLK